MKITIDTDNAVLCTSESGLESSFPLYSKEAFEIISRQWVKVGWNEKYVYTFSWMGRPIIQLPEDLIRIQEVLWELKPDVIIETGVAHGGSLVFYAGLCKVIGKGRVIGIDIEIRPHNRKAIEEHLLSEWITLIERSSTDGETLEDVRSLIAASDTVMVILDSNHGKDHVLRELKAYGPLVTDNSYIVATDGIMIDLRDVPRGGADWNWNNPVSAVREFLSSHSEFVLEPPRWVFNESHLTASITHWPEAWLKKVGGDR